MIMDKSCTIQDVFERFYPSYEKRSNPPAHHRKTAYLQILLERYAYSEISGTFILI